MLGVEVDALSIPDLNALITEAIESRTRMVVGNHNLHSIYHFHHDAKMRSYYAATDFVYIDGMAIVAMGRLLGNDFSRDHRVTFVDWMDPFANAAAEHGWRVFFLGSRPGVAERGAGILRRKYPGLQMQTANGFFDPRPGSPEAERVLSGIERWRPDLLIVGMGMPRQEHWIVDHLDKLSAHVILNSGAVMDYFAGEIPTPPRWAGRIGLEWFFRLIAEPRRLWFRYLVEPWFIVYKFTGDLLSQRVFTGRSSREPEPSQDISGIRRRPGLRLRNISRHPRP